MQKILSNVFAAMPLIYTASLLSFTQLDITDEQLFLFLAVYILAALLLAILYAASSANVPVDQTARSSIWHYSTNLAVWVAEIVFWCIRYVQDRIATQNGAMEGGLGLVLLIVIFLPHWLSYLFTRIAGAVCCARILRKEHTPETVTLHILLQLFPVTDLVSSIWVYRKVKQNAHI